MDDAALVRIFQRFGDLPRNGQRFLQRNRSLGDAFGQRRTFHQLHH